MIRVAAVGDVHFGTDSAGLLRPHLEGLDQAADVLLLAGDLTRLGRVEEAETLLRELESVRVPVISVLGNHDFESGCQDEIRELLEQNEVRVLDGEAVTLRLDGGSLGIAGAKGFGGGFAGACATDFGEPQIKAFVRHTKDVSARLEKALAGLQTDVKIALLHYSPVEHTLAGERLEIYPFLGSYLLAEAIDRAGADLVLHGHAHSGTEHGVTPAGIHVRNVSLPVIRNAYHVYCLGSGDLECGQPAGVTAGRQRVDSGR